MLLLAATALEKMQAVPTKVWINVGLAVLIFFVAVILIRRAAEMNKMLLGVIIFVVISSVGFHWVYYRNEPKFISPLIEPLAKFLPTAGKQAEKSKRMPTPQ
jgi:putative effector of murein hydrolase